MELQVLELGCVISSNSNCGHCGELIECVHYENKNLQTVPLAKTFRKGIQLKSEFVVLSGFNSSR